MERDNNKSKSSIIFIIISLILIIPLSIFSIYNILEYNKQSDEKNKLNNELVNLEKDLKYKKEDQTIILNDLNNLKNIDENISKEKKKVFELAKELEEKIQNNETEYKIAYITFDDGPYYLTYSVLDTLKKKIGTGAIICLREEDIPLSRDVLVIPAWYI